MDETTTPDTGEDQAAAAEQRKERAALGCLLVVAVGVGGAVAVAVPETAYYAAGLGTAVAVRKVRGWVAGRRKQAADEPEEFVEVDIVAALHELSPAGALNVRLTQLQEAAGLPDTKAVRALLNEAGIPVKDGVRAGGKNGPGVHHTAIPRSCDPSSDGCWCRSDANTNANNGTGEGPREGFRVEHTGQAGTTVYDLSETHQRRHTAKA